MFNAWETPMSSQENFAQTLEQELQKKPWRAEKAQPISGKTTVKSME